jgi:hypothetical protein
MDQSSTARNLWLLGLVLGAGYWFGAAARSGLAFTFLADLPGALVVSWKCAATGALALSTFLATRGTRLQRLAVTFALIWFADLMLALGQAIVSGVVFTAAHLVAASAFAQLDPREQAKGPALALAGVVLALALASLVTVWQLGGSPLFAIFPLFSAIATALAARSTLPLALVALGYAIFFLSDAIVVVDMTASPGPRSWGWLSWLTYFGGLTLLARGLAVAAERG